MADNIGESSRKKRRVPDDHPPHMQFFKWAKMKYLSKEAVEILQSYCYGPNREVCDFMYLLMRYYHRQLAMENDYRAKLLQAGIEEIKPEVVSSSSQPKANVDASNDSKKTDEEEIQLLMEQKRLIEQELKELTDGEEEGEEDDVEEEAAPVEATAEQAVAASDNAAIPPAFPYNSPIPFDPLQSPRFVVKQEPLDEVAASIPVVPSAPTTPQLRQPMLGQVKQEPCSSQRASLEPALSTIAVADEPLTTPAAQLFRKREHKPDAATVVNTAAEAHNQKLVLPHLKPPTATVFTSESCANTEPKLLVLPVLQQQQQQQQQQQHHRQQAPSTAPRAPEDPVKVAILSCNLVGLNQQIGYVNDIRELARKQELAAETFYITAEQQVDPSPNFKLRVFKEMKKYAEKAAQDTDDALATFAQPVIDHLRSTLRAVRTEIEGIWDRVCAAIKAHQDQAAAQQQKKKQQKQQARAARQQHPHQNKQRLKRPRTDSPAQPAAKRSKETLLHTPDGPTEEAAATSSSSSSSSWVPPPTSATKAQQKAAKAPWFDCSIVCAFCDAAHDSVKCTVYATHAQREARRKELNLCYHCLRHFERYHLSRCPDKKKMCAHCSGHTSHAAFCKRLHKPNRPNQWAGNREPRRSNTTEPQFSPLTTPIYEEVVRTTGTTAESPQC